MALHFKYILLQFCTRFFGIILSRESLPKGRYWYTVDLLVLVQIGCFYTEIILFSYYKTFYLDKEVKYTEPFPFRKSSLFYRFCQTYYKPDKLRSNDVTPSYCGI